MKHYRKRITLLLMITILICKSQAQEPLTDASQDALFATCINVDTQPLKSSTALENDDWLYYDDGIYDTSIAFLPVNVPFSWAVMFPSHALQAYGDFTLTKVALYEMNWNYGNLILSVYYGNDQRPMEKMAEQCVAMLHETGFHLIELECPVEIDTARNLWIVFTETSNTEQFSASVSMNVVDPDPNARWLQTENDKWEDIMNHNTPQYQFQIYQWMIRGYVTDDPMGVEVPLSYETIGVYPNPTTGLVTVKGKDLKQAEVFNTLGQRVVTAKGEGGETLQIDIADLPAGFYFVNVTDGEGRKCIRKVVKE